MIKYVGLEPIFFSINLNATSSTKVFSTFDFVLLSIVLLNKKKSIFTFKYYIYNFIQKRYIYNLI